MGPMRSLILAVVLFSAAPCLAGQGQWSLSLSPGISVPVGEPGDSFENQHRTSSHLQAALNYEVDDGGWVGVELGYSAGHKFRGRMNGTDFDGDRKVDAVTFTSDIDTKMLYLTPTVKVGGSLDAGLKYYFGVGAGLYTFWSGSGRAILSGRTAAGGDVTGTTVPFAEAANSYTGLNIGHALGYEITDNFELDVDIRYHMIFQPENVAGIVVPALRFTFLF